MADLSLAPRVSVIIIFLNEALFLRDAIQSVRAQTFADWEMILVDDGSRDGSERIARDEADGEQIRYVCHSDHANRGMSASRNAGIAAARGEFIAFLDADDVWLPVKLADQVAIFSADPRTDMVYGRAWIWHEWQQGAATKDYFCDLGVPPHRLYPPTSLLPMLIRNKAQTPMSGNAVMRRTLVDRVRGFEDEFGGMFEDQAFFAKCHLVSHCHVDGRFWMKYRQHGASCTARFAGRLTDLRARARFLRWLGRYMRRHDGRNPEIRRAMCFAWREIAEQFGRASVRRLLGMAQ